MYALFVPIQATYKESQSLKGFAKMKYDKEHKEQLSSIEQFAEQISGYAGITELNFKIINQRIEKILVSKPVEVDGKKIQRLTIHYKFIGALETLE